MSDNEIIEEFIEAQEATAKNIERLAEEIGVGVKTALETGASREEQKVERQKVALFRGESVEKAGGDESPAETAAALFRQNQANIAAVTRAAGVPSRKLAGDTATTSTDRASAAIFGGGHGRDTGKRETASDDTADD